jgi:hypothetical protein
VYNYVVRRTQLYLDERLDDLLESEARAQGVSKASLVRACVAERFDARHPDADLIGSIHGPPVDDLDAAIYGE